MRKIFCPTDFSAVAQNAIAYAAKLTQQVEAELFLVNVQSPAEMTADEIVRGSEMSIQGIAAQLEDQSREVASMFKISCYAEVIEAKGSWIKAVAKRIHDADLVVMGTAGPGDLLDFFSGTNTYKVIREASVPLLLLPALCSFSKITRIVYAFDYLRERKLPLVQLLPWIQVLGSELSVLQVMEEAYSGEAELDLLAIQQLIKSQTKNSVPLQFDTIRSSDIAGSINQYILRNQVDVLALCTVHHGLAGKMFHKSVIKKLSAQAQYPVLVFHG